MVGLGLIVLMRPRKGVSGIQILTRLPSWFNLNLDKERWQIATALCINNELVYCNHKLFVSLLPVEA